MAVQRLVCFECTFLHKYTDWSQAPEPVVASSAATTTTTSRGVTAARRSFESNASIVLIGIRGSGKSSLAVLAASAYNRRLIDFERAFLDHTGQSLAAHRVAAGVSEHHRRHRQIFEQVLRDHGKGCVIVCNFSDLEQGSRLLRQFSHTHPVVHIVRDVKGIQAHVKVWNEEKIAQLLAISGRLLRQCSNFEFFNQTELLAEPSQTLQRIDEEAIDVHAGSTSSATPFLKLKRAERDFLKFLGLVIGRTQRRPSHQSAYPLSQIPIEHRRYTYAVAVMASDVANGLVDLEEIQTGADAIQIIYEIPVHSDPQGVSYALGEVYSTVRRSTILPLVAEVRYHAENVDDQKRQTYMQYLQYCLRFAPEYLVLNLSINSLLLKPLLAISGNTKIIGQASQVDDLEGSWNGEECRDLYFKGRELGCTIVQVSGGAKSAKDVMAVSSFIYRILGDTEVSVSAFCDGEMARQTQCFNEGLTPVISDSHRAPAGNRNAVASITAQQATKALFSAFILEAQKFCIIGANVDFSLSPAMHNAAYEACGLPHVFRSLSSGSLEPLRVLAAEHDFGGSAITQPYKVEVVGLLQSLSRHSKIIRAVNTVLPIRGDLSKTRDHDIATSRNRNNPHVVGLHGDNTDWIGIRACIRRGLSPINTIRPSSCGLVLGAGGMARAAIYSMIHLGVQNVFIYNRTRSTAQELADYYNDPAIVEAAQKQGAVQYTIQVIDSIEQQWPEGVRPPTMIVSSIPPQTVNGVLEATFTIPKTWLKSPTGGVVVELTYNPLVTSLVRQVRAEAHRGWIVMNGLDMLPEQAFAQFELFTGRRAPRRTMRAVVFEAFRNNHEAMSQLPGNAEVNVEAPKIT